MNKLHKYQERVFDFIIYLTYTLIILSSLGISEYAPKYISELDYYVRIYICLFLIWRFNPLRTHYEFTNLDRKIAFSAGIFIFTTSTINQILMYLDIQNVNNILIKKFT